MKDLTSCMTPDGVFTILAIDHRDSMRVLLDPDDPGGVPGSRLTETKLWLLRELGGEGTGNA